jgi:hypothetical protein
MIKIILYILDKIPYKTKFGLSISDLLKYRYNKTHPYKCLCGGIIRCFSASSPEGWTVECTLCNQIYDED